MNESKRLGDAWTESLPKSHREALLTAFHVVCDGFFDDLASVANDGLVFADTHSGALLPVRLRHRYTEAFAKSFFLCFTTLGWKLAQPEQVTPSCVAEELAVRILMDEATRLLEEDGVEADFGEFEDVYLQDSDVDFLYSLAYDGIEDTELADELGMAHLHFDEWFTPFLNATTAVHPYSHSTD